MSLGFRDEVALLLFLVSEENARIRIMHFGFGRRRVGSLHRVEGFGASGR